VISNPPYSVSAFRNNASKYYGEKDFELYNALTDQSSEIECLFIERTKQLLKEGGLAGIILPSSILSNTGIYTKAREIIFKYFEIVGIAELGSNTFMATGTNTVTLFLRRRDNYAYDNTFANVQKSSWCPSISARMGKRAIPLKTKYDLLSQRPLQVSFDSMCRPHFLYARF
jgi:type I restriction enzyme M protein